MCIKQRIRNSNKVVSARQWWIGCWFGVSAFEAEFRQCYRLMQMLDELWRKYISILFENVYSDDFLDSG